MIVHIAPHGLNRRYYAGHASSRKYERVPVEPFVVGKRYMAFYLATHWGMIVVKRAGISNYSYAGPYYREES